MSPSPTTLPTLSPEPARLSGEFPRYAVRQPGAALPGPLPRAGRKAALQATRGGLGRVRALVQALVLMRVSAVVTFPSPRRRFRRSLSSAAARGWPAIWQNCQMRQIPSS